MKHRHKQMTIPIARQTRDEAQHGIRRRIDARKCSARVSIPSTLWACHALGRTEHSDGARHGAQPGCISMNVPRPTVFGASNMPDKRQSRRLIGGLTGRPA